MPTRDTLSGRHCRAASPANGKRRSHILCIDDDPSMLSTLAEMLEGDGHCVIQAPSGQEGIDAFMAAQTGNRPIDAVITDLIMPDLRGDQVAKSIKRAAPGISIVLLSGSPGVKGPDGELPEGIDLFLTKPIGLKEIRRVLKKVLTGNGRKPSLRTA